VERDSAPEKKRNMHKSRTRKALGGNDGRAGGQSIIGRSGTKTSREKGGVGEAFQGEKKCRTQRKTVVL